MSKSQKERVKERLEMGLSITPLDALQLYGCFRLASIINRLRGDGMDIITNIVRKYGNSPEDDVTYAEYHLRGAK